MMHKLNLKLMVFFLLSILLSSCASDGDCPSKEDSPKPTSNMAECKSIKSLELGSICRVPVLARDFETDVGLKVKQHEEYKVTVPCDQVWYDCTRRNLPLCGEEGSFVMNLLSFNKKQPNSLWFSVIAEVKSADKKSTHYDLCKDPDKPSKTAVFTVDNDGELFLYPNDAEGHYGNNKGMIWLEIQRLK